MQKESRHFPEVRSAKINTLRREEKQFREPSPQPRKLLDHVRDVLRVNHYSVRTEEAYVGWRVTLLLRAKDPALLSHALRLRAAINKRRRPLHWLFGESTQEIPTACSRRFICNRTPWTLEVDLLRGISGTRGCLRARTLPQRAAVERSFLKHS